MFRNSIQGLKNLEEKSVVVAEGIFVIVECVLQPCYAVLLNPIDPKIVIQQLSTTEILLTPKPQTQNLTPQARFADILKAGLGYSSTGTTRSREACPFAMAVFTPLSSEFRIYELRLLGLGPTLNPKPKSLLGFRASPQSLGFHGGGFRVSGRGFLGPPKGP